MPTISKLSDVVTPEELRAMLGVAVKEMKDGVIDLPVYLRSVKVACAGTDSRIWSLYAGLPSDTSTYTADQEAFSELFLTYLAWATARVVAIALPTTAAQQIGDGNAQLSRNDDAGVSTIANIDLQISKVVPLLVNATAVLAPSAASQVKAAYAPGRFGASTDPVTGI